MTGPQGPAAAGGDWIRADADRERVIETLKDAFVRGRLTRDEPGERAGRALSARTRADLAALTADIPAVPPVPATAELVWPPPPVAPPRRRPLAKAAARSGACLVTAAAAVWFAFLADPDGSAPDPYRSLAPGFLFFAYAAVVTALGFALYGVHASVEERHSRGHPPPQPGPRGRARPGERRDGAGRDPVPPEPVTAGPRPACELISHGSTGCTLPTGRSGRLVP